MFPQNYRSLCILTLGLVATAATTDIVRAQETDPALVAPAVQAKRLVNVPSQVQGVVIEVKVKDGQRVKAGDVLARIDDRLVQMEIKRAKLLVKVAEFELQSAEATLGEAKNQLARAKRLRPAITQGELDMKKLTVSRIESEMRARVMKVELARVDLEIAMIHLSKYQLVAPVGGIVQRIQRQRGEAVREFETMVQIRAAN